MKVAVTGASGFIGSHLLSGLITRGYSPVVLDFDSHEYPGGVEVIKGNLLTGEGLVDFLKDANIVIHLAGQVLLGKTTMEDGNVKTTANLINACKTEGIKKFIFSSSVAVYGNFNGEVFKETDVCHPDTEYGESKLEAEKIIRNWSKESISIATIFRFFSVYGPGNTKGVVYNLCRDFIDKGRVTIYGNGKQKRDLVFVDDVSELIDRALVGNFNGVYNIGTGRYHSILDLVSILSDISGQKCAIEFKDPEKEKVGEIVCSVEKLKKDFGWLPGTDIREGMRKVFESLKRDEK